MAIFVDMYGNEYVKDGDKYFCPATQKYASRYQALSPYWRDGDTYKCWTTRYVPAGGTACADEERTVHEVVSFNTAEQAKQHVVKQLNIRWRQMAVLGGSW